MPGSDVIQALKRIIEEAVKESSWYQELRVIVGERNTPQYAHKWDLSGNTPKKQNARLKHEWLTSPMENFTNSLHVQLEIEKTVKVTIYISYMPETDSFDSTVEIVNSSKYERVYFKTSPARGNIKEIVSLSKEMLEDAFTKVQIKPTYKDEKDACLEALVEVVPVYEPTFWGMIKEIWDSAAQETVDTVT